MALTSNSECPEHGAGFLQQTAMPPSSGSGTVRLGGTATPMTRSRVPTTITIGRSGHPEACLSRSEDPIPHSTLHQSAKLGQQASRLTACYVRA